MNILLLKKKLQVFLGSYGVGIELDLSLAFDDFKLRVYLIEDSTKFFGFHSGAHTHHEVMCDELVMCALRLGGDLCAESFLRTQFDAFVGVNTVHKRFAVKSVRGDVYGGGSEYVCDEEGDPFSFGKYEDAEQLIAFLPPGYYEIKKLNIISRVKNKGNG